MKKSNRIALYIFLLSIIAALAIYIFFPQLYQPSANESVQTAENGAIQKAVKTLPIPIKAEPARKGELIIRISASGRTAARRQVIITSKVNSSISELPVKEGQFVRKGDLLTKFDDQEYRIALEEARQRKLKATIEYGKMKGERKHSLVSNTDGKSMLLNLQESGENLQKVQQRFENGQATEAEMQLAKTEVEAAKLFAMGNKEQLIAAQSGLAEALLSTKKAELSLQNCEIRAPFSGLVGNIKLPPYQRISAGEECLTLLDLSELKIEVGVLESEIGFLKPGRKAAITFPAFPTERFYGHIDAINPIIDKETKTCRVTVLMPNPKGKIKAGIFAEVKLDAQLYQNRLIVPKTSILIRDQRKLLFIVRDKLAKWCYVDIGLENADFVEITGSTLGLKEGEPVITSGHYTLTHDAAVRVSASPGNK